MNPSLRWGVHCEVHVVSYVKAVLSVPALSGDAHFHEKDLLTDLDGPADGKFTLAEHLGALADRHMIAGDAPLMVTGLRNSLVNLRAPIVWRGRPYAVEGERPDESRRPYYGLGAREGRIVLGRALGGSDETWSEFFVAGVPVLWDDADDDILMNMMIAEAGDHSHVFHLPRGRHPDATDATRSAWADLHAVFAANIHADLPTAAAAMRLALSRIEPPLLRCDDYLSAVIGIKADGALVCLYAHGCLESLGRRAKALGCRRAVCIENSGSVMPTYLPRGFRGEPIPLLRAPNFRPRGRAVLILELENAVFESVPADSTGDGRCPGP